jgi:excisionase family DNA binding protein
VENTKEQLIMAEYLTVPQAAKECHVAIETVRGWIKKGLLPKSKAGGRVLITRQSLDDFIRSSSGNQPATNELHAAA